MTHFKGLRVTFWSLGEEGWEGKKTKGGNEEEEEREAGRGREREREEEREREGVGSQWGL